MNDIANDPLKELALDIFRRKKIRRSQMAALSIEEKIEILIRLQNWASEISRVTRGVYRKPWASR